MDNIFKSRDAIVKYDPNKRTPVETGKFRSKVERDDAAETRERLTKRRRTLFILPSTDEALKRTLHVTPGEVRAGQRGMARHQPQLAIRHRADSKYV
eukprot:6487594-Amphidinium_carterae.2